jgi:hypothetical protein
LVDLSSDEEDIFPDTSRDEKFTWKLFGDLNHGLHRPSSDGNVIILSGSDEEEEVREEDTANAEATPPFTGNSSATTVSTVDDVDAPDGVPDDSNGSCTPDWVKGDSSNGGDEAGRLRLPHQKGVSAGSGL